MQVSTPSSETSLHIHIQTLPAPPPTTVCVKVACLATGNMRLARGLRAGIVLPIGASTGCRKTLGEVSDDIFEGFRSYPGDVGLEMMGVNVTGDRGRW